MQTYLNKQKKKFTELKVPLSTWCFKTWTDDSAWSVHWPLTCHFQWSSHLWDCHPEFTTCLFASSTMQVHTSNSLLLFSWEFTAKSHSQRRTKNCLPVCYFKVTYVSRELHGHSKITVSISANIFGQKHFHITSCFSTVLQRITGHCTVLFSL